MKFFLLFLVSLNVTALFSQSVQREYKTQRITQPIKIDGELHDVAYMNATPMTDFIEWRPTPFKKEDSTNRTRIFILYDNNSIYIGGHCFERTSDSVSKELVGRDVVGINDFVGVIFDTYNDKVNAFGFYVTPYGEQFDARYSNSANGEDASWNAVWHSASKMQKDGWTFEMRIPYSALRFSNKANQTWGLNITRRRNKTGQQYMWNPIDPKVNGFVNQEGLMTGLQNIKPPVRLALSPYFSAYLNHFPNSTPGVKDVTSSLNGGMDVKYGISEGFTLDMTLIPDFGQVQSDNQVLNLSPFEVKFNEYRTFFTEGTELFNKGDLFYSRRIGSQPIHYYSVQDSAWDNSHIHPDEKFLKNPSESKLINATKISGRTSKKLGIGFFNAVTRNMYAEVENVNGIKRKILTNPATNYNIIVLDQTLKNNSAVSFINTNVTREGGEYDANVSAALFDLNNKKNTFNINGKFAVSQLYGPLQDKSVGRAHNLSVGKTGGSWVFQAVQDLADSKYDINDMGILFNNNFLDHYVWTAYRWQKPGKWFNRAQINYNAYYSMLHSPVQQQKISSKFQSFNTNVNAWAQLKNLWFISMFIGYGTEGNNFYEPRVAGYSFRTPSRIQFSPGFESNPAKKYYLSLNYFLGLRKLFNSPNHEFNFSQRYRFNDKFSMSQDFLVNPATNDAGFYGLHYENNQLKDILFSRRDLTTIQNIFSFKYNFNWRSGITFRARHYWSRVRPLELYDLQEDGSLKNTIHQNVAIQGRNINFFNIDAVYTWQFAPGSFINVVWKDQSAISDQLLHENYIGNFGNMITAPQNNNLSLKIIYWLDYVDLRKRKPVQ